MGLALQEFSFWSSWTVTVCSDTGVASSKYDLFSQKVYSTQRSIFRITETYMYTLLPLSGIPPKLLGRHDLSLVCPVLLGPKLKPSCCRPWLTVSLSVWACRCWELPPFPLYRSYCLTDLSFALSFSSAFAKQPCCWAGAAVSFFMAINQAIVFEGMLLI